jgi:8-oxo-dGTP diphosphatase
MSYCYDYPRPAVTTDVVVFKNKKGQQSVLLIQRKNPPFKDMWALPGGFLDMEEDLLTCAQRELKEETNLSGLQLNELGTYSKPGRDPRGRTISVAYVAVLDKDKGSDLAAGDDAGDVKWFEISKLPKLAFDHDRIIHDAVCSL